MEDYNFNTTRLINTVGLSKIINRFPDKAPNIVSQCDLSTYIEDNNIIYEFTPIRQSYALEIRKTSGRVKLGSGYRYGYDKNR